MNRRSDSTSTCVGASLLYAQLRPGHVLGCRAWRASVTHHCAGPAYSAARRGGPGPTPGCHLVTSCRPLPSPPVTPTSGFTGSVRSERQRHDHLWEFSRRIPPLPPPPTDLNAYSVLPSSYYRAYRVDVKQSQRSVRHDVPVRSTPIHAVPAPVDPSHPGQGNWTSEGGCPFGPQQAVPLERNGQTVSLQQRKFHVTIPFICKCACRRCHALSADFPPPPPPLPKGKK